LSVGTKLKLRKITILRFFFLIGEKFSELCLTSEVNVCENCATGEETSLNLRLPD